MTPEQRQELIRLLERGEETSPEWPRILFLVDRRVLAAQAVHEFISFEAEPG